VTTDDTLTTLVSFNDADWAYPWGALTLGNDGNFYGTTDEGGTTHNDGSGGYICIPAWPNFMPNPAL
jgi:hypothetical protein